RPGAGGVEERGVRVPSLRTTTHHERRGRYWLTDQASVHDGPRRLKPCAHESGGRASDSEPALLRERQPRPGRGPIGGDGSLAVDVLACLEGGVTDGGVGGGVREVDGHVDLTARRRLGDRGRPYAGRLRPQAGPLGVDGGDRHDREALEPETDAQV